MKIKLLLLSAFIFFGFSFANAQISEGKFLLGGNIFFNNQKSFFENGPDNKSNNAGADVRLGKFISPTSAIGGILEYSHAGAQLNRTNTYGIGVFYRKYKSLGSNFYLFGEGNIQYSYSKAENKNGTGKSTTNAISLNLLPGISYAVSQKFQLELTIPNLLTASYATSKIPDNNPSKQNSFSFGAGITQNGLSNLGLGFKLIL